MCNIFRRDVTKDSVSGNLTLLSTFLWTNPQKLDWTPPPPPPSPSRQQVWAQSRGERGRQLRIVPSLVRKSVKAMVEVYIWICWRFWTSCNEMFSVVGVGLGYEWSRAEVLLCGIASTFHNITPIPICLRCQDDHQSVAAIKLSRKQMVYSRARSKKQNFVFSSQASLHSAHFPQSQSFGQEKAKHMCFCE